MVDSKSHKSFRKDYNKSMHTKTISLNYNHSEKEKPYILFLGIENWSSQYGKQYEVSSKIKNNFIIQLSNLTTRYLSKRTEIRMLKIHPLHCHVHWNIIRSNQDTETPINGYTNQTWSTRAMECYSDTRKKGNTVIYANTNEPRKYNARRNKPVKDNTAWFH